MLRLLQRSAKERGKGGRREGRTEVERKASRVVSASGREDGASTNVFTCVPASSAVTSQIEGREGFGLS